MIPSWLCLQFIGSLIWQFIKKKTHHEDEKNDRSDDYRLQQHEINYTEKGSFIANEKGVFPSKTPLFYYLRSEMSFSTTSLISSGSSLSTAYIIDPPG